MPSNSGQLTWTGSGNASTAANWTDFGVFPYQHFAPTSTDQLLYGNGGLGSSNPCTWDFTSQTVDRVIMDSHYTSTLTIPSGNTLHTTNYFQQNGTLSMSGTATVSTGDYIDIYGTVSASSVTTSHLDASGSFFLYSSGTISATGAAALEVTSANFSDSGAITLASGAGMTINGPFTQSAGSITLGTGSTLTYLSGGSSSAYPIFQGSTTTVTMSAATIATDTKLDISGATLSCPAGGNTIAGVGGVGGSVGIPNSGTISVGTASGPSTATLTLSTGSLTVGALTASLSASGGTLNLWTGTTLTMPAAGNLVVKSLGVINMYGAGIMLGSTALDIRAADSGATAGTLQTFGTGNAITGSVSDAGIVNVGASGKPASSLAVTGTFTDSGALNVNGGCTLTVGGALGASGTIDMYGAGLTAATLGLNGGTLTTHGSDAITAPLTNAGTIVFVGTLHTLTLTGASTYTQTSAGTLNMRLDNGTGAVSPSDVLSVGGAATLGGTLTVSAYAGALNAGQTWDIISAGAPITTDFAVRNFPNDGNRAWRTNIVGAFYDINN